MWQVMSIFSGPAYVDAMGVSFQCVQKGNSTSFAQLHTKTSPHVTKKEQLLTGIHWVDEISYVSVCFGSTFAQIAAPS